jgi:hypothetical protein
MPRKRATKHKRPVSDPNVAAYDVVARLTGSHPKKAAKKAARPKAQKKAP